MGEEIRPEAEAAERRALIHDFLQANAARVGPWDDDGSPTAMPLLTEWILISTWTDGETGSNYIVRQSSENLLRTHRLGLLYDSIDDWPDREED
jgi:hypothetical protein